MYKYEPVLNKDGLLENSMFKYGPVLNKDDSLNLKNALELADVKLNRFQQEVHNAIRDDNHAPFRKLLRRCFMMEFREEQTIRILIECRRFEQEHVKPSLLSYDGAALRSQQEQHDKSLPPQTARVAVLYGFIYFRGVGLTRNKALARRYFDLGVAMNCMDAFLMAGIVRNRPDYVKKATDPLLLDIVNCTQDPDVTRLITTLRDDAPSTEKQADAVEASGDPSALYYLAIKIASEIQHMRWGTRRENEARLDKIHHASELYLRSYQTFLRRGDERNVPRVDTEFVKFYYKHLSDFKKDEESPTLQQAAKTVLYYYGIIDPSLYETLVITTENKETVLYCILFDGVSSSREKMRRVIKLLGPHLPPNLFAGPLTQSLENLGHLAYQAVADCLALYSHLPIENREEIAAELKEFSTFADEVLWRLERRDVEILDDSHENATITARQIQNRFQAIFDQKSKKPDDAHFSALKSRMNTVLNHRYQCMANAGDAGFSMALRLMIGERPGSKKLVLPKDINTALRLYALIKDHPIDFLFPLGESERRKTDLLIAILLEIRFGTLDNEYAQIWKDLKEALHEHSDELDLQNAKQKKPVDIEPEITFDRQALSIAARQTLQDLADFYGLIEEARIPRLVGVDVPTKVELFNLFKENHRFLKAIEQAIEFFQSPTYQPSRYNIFSSTFGKTAKYQEQLTLAKDLLKACEFQIYDCTKLAKEIEQFLSRSVDHQKPWSFALVLMKVMASNVSPLIPKVDFDLMKAMKNHEKEPELILIEFYSAFKDHFLRTNTFVSEFKFHL